MSPYTEEEKAEKKKKQKKFRLSELDVHTVGLVDVPAVQRAVFLVAKRAAPSPLEEESPATRKEWALQTAQVADAAKMEFLTTLNEEKLREELSHDPAQFYATLTTLESYVLHERPQLRRLADLGERELELELYTYPPEQQGIWLDKLEGFLRISGQEA